MTAPDPAREAADREATSAAQRAQIRADFQGAIDFLSASSDRAVKAHREIGRLIRRKIEAEADLARLQSDLRDARNEAESAREQARGENALRVGAEAELERVRAEWGRWEELARAYHKQVGKTLTSDPSPPAALKERVVEAAMAWSRAVPPASDNGSPHSNLLLACAALDAATPKPSGAVGLLAEAREIAAECVRKATTGEYPSSAAWGFAMIPKARADRLVAVLDALDSARAERKGGA